ncbi:Zinc finger, CCHC-type superfamily [Sesbania bispinosa]|nr:Zinc finger, CCHC-type superfamily [Sesbania bispinosa]
MLNPKYTRMLPTHRKLSEVDILEMNNMRNAGITTPQIYGSFASQSGGYNNVGFRKRDLYNEIGRQRMLQLSDAKGAIKHLREREQNEGSMFWRHTTDSEGRLQRLFWCDGQCQVDYKLFGDVLAFDATYRKNKYHFPLVVFSGINHHNQSTIFASCLVADETEETYVWVLEQLMVAMKGKMPSAVITDGDLAMRNAIKRVLPNAHHRLCAWHLCRNAASNVKNPKMVSMFRKCMLGDYEVSEFKHGWEVMVKEFRLEENNWVKELYEKKRMWATAYIRGNFFAGFRTTSRCEGLHGQLGKFVHSRTDLVGFLKKYGRFLEVLRYNELEADFESVDHGVKDSAYEIRDGRNSIWDSVFDARCGYLDFLCKKMNRLGGRSATRFNEIKDWVSTKINLYSEAHLTSGDWNENGTDEGGPTLKDPIRVGSKGCAAGSSSQARRRPHKCRQCGVAGHNRTTCPKKTKYEASIELGECEGEMSQGTIQCWIQMEPPSWIS